jgi:hypothetical protein
MTLDDVDTPNLQAASPTSGPDAVPRPPAKRQKVRFPSGDTACAAWHYQRAPRGEVVRLPGGHYEPFMGGHDHAAEVQLSFLRRHLLDGSQASAR